MSLIDACLSLLILSGVFALICLGLLFLKTSTTLSELQETLKAVDATLERVNKTLDDVNSKLEDLDEPVKMVGGFFTKDKKRSGLWATILSIRDTIFRRN